MPFVSLESREDGKGKREGDNVKRRKEETALFSLPIVPHAKLFLKPFYLKCYKWDTTTSLCGGENSM